MARNPNKRRERLLEFLSEAPKGIGKASVYHQGGGQLVKSDRIGEFTQIMRAQDARAMGAIPKSIPLVKKGEDYVSFMDTKKRFQHERDVLEFFKSKGYSHDGERVVHTVLRGSGRIPSKREQQLKKAVLYAALVGSIPLGIKFKRALPRLVKEVRRRTRPPSILELQKHYTPIQRARINAARKREVFPTKHMQVNYPAVRKYSPRIRGRKN